MLSKPTTVTRLFKSWRLPWVLITMLVFAGLIKLGFWQLQRGNEKQLRLERIEHLTNQAPLTLNEVLNLNDPINDLPVELYGKFNNQHKFLLDNQTYKGQLGYRVLQVFEQANSKHAVLVNLGWIQGSIDRNFIPTLTDIPATKSIKGNVRIIEQNIMLAEQDYQQISWPMRVQQVEIDKISQLINKELLPFTVFLDKKEDIGYTKNWQPVVMPPQKHFGYSVQWFALASAWLLLMLWASYKQLNENKNKPNE